MYSICGACLHANTCHEKHNGKFMYCSACFRLCDIEEFNEIHKPTDYKTHMEISAKK